MTDEKHHRNNGTFGNYMNSGTHKKEISALNF